MTAKKSKLLEDLAKQPEESTCGIRKVLQNVTPEEADALRNIFEQKLANTHNSVPWQKNKITYTWLMDVLKKNGHSVTRKNLTDHIWKRCKCYGSV